MENEITLKEAWIKLFGDNPVSWLKWFIVFIVFGLSFYILVYKVFGKIEYKTNIKRKIEKAQAKGNVVKGILILCSDNLTGIKEAINAAFPNTVQQRCIVHMIRNSVKFVNYKDLKVIQNRVGHEM